jgi:hypothetical protein
LSHLFHLETLPETCFENLEMLQASVAAALLSAATAHATTIDFDAASVGSLLHADNTLLGLADVYYGTSYTEDGFVLTSSLGHRRCTRCLWRTMTIP